MKDLYELIAQSSEKMQGDLLAWRHRLHQHPELSFKEVKTTEFVAAKLREFGYENVQCGFGPIKTGVCAVVGKGKKCLALRADMDALPIQETTDLEFKSCCDGVMHACGHDMHTTVLLAVAKILKSVEVDLPGRVKLIFQPAEETRCKIFEKPLSGAGYVVRSGAIDDVDAVFGMHVWGIFEANKIFVRVGPTMMASGRFNLEVIGKGTHGASPHLGYDPITTACQIVTAAQTIVSRETSPIDPALITFGTIHAGTATNIIPEKVVLSGTLRAASEQTVRFMGRRLGEMADLTARAHQCRTSYDLLINGPAVVNDAGMVETLRQAATRMVGEDRVCDVQMLTGSEDFREYSSRRPSALFFMGMHDERRGIGQPQHDPAFISNDDVLVDAVKVMAASAVRWLEKNC